MRASLRLAEGGALAAHDRPEPSRWRRSERSAIGKRFSVGLSAMLRQAAAAVDAILAG
jgi:hypothetical protein